MTYETLKYQNSIKSNGYKKIKFNDLTRETYKRKIKKLEKIGYVLGKSKPYSAFLYKDQVVACIWIDKDNEVCYVCAENHRRKGLITGLMIDLIDEVFKGKRSNLLAEPVNQISENLLYKIGFRRDWGLGNLFWSYEL